MLSILLMIEISRFCSSNTLNRHQRLPYKFLFDSAVFILDVFIYFIVYFVLYWFLVGFSITFPLICFRTHFLIVFNWLFIYLPLNRPALVLSFFAVSTPITIYYRFLETWSAKWLKFPTFLIQDVTSRSTQIVDILYILILSRYYFLLSLVFKSNGVS